MDFQLTGKRVVVTGSSSGIGVAVAAILAAEGVKVAVHERNHERAEAVAAMIRTEGLKRFLKAFTEKRGWGDDVPKAEDYLVTTMGQTVNRAGEPEDMGYRWPLLPVPLRFHKRHQAARGWWDFTVDTLKFALGV